MQRWDERYDHPHREHWRFVGIVYLTAAVLLLAFWAFV